MSDLNLKLKNTRLTLYHMKTLIKLILVDQYLLLCSFESGLERSTNGLLIFLDDAR